MNDESLQRCPWVKLDDSLYVQYHDEEWGVPVHDDQKLFEFLVLETFQAGLSWRTVLHKRENFRKAFADFDYHLVAKFTDRHCQSLLNDVGIIRNKQKINATVNNAKRFLDVEHEFGSFSEYMWSWVNQKPVVHSIKILKDYPVTIEEAILWSKDLKKRGFQFLGPTTVYAHMQAVGMVNDHSLDCFRCADLSVL